MSKWETIIPPHGDYKNSLSYTSYQMGLAYNLWKLVDDTLCKNINRSVDNGISYSIFCDFVDPAGGKGPITWPKKDDKDVYKK